MKVNISKFVRDAGIEEKIYPGKRIVKKCPQQGEYKSHSVVLDWRNPLILQVNVKAGQSGKDLPADLLKKYPVSFQTPTYVNISVGNDTADETGNENGNEEDEGDEGDEESGKSGKGGGGKGMKKKADDDRKVGMASAFSKVIEGKIPEAGKITEMVVMGMQISERAFDRVFEVLTHQIEKGKIAATDLLAEAGKFVTRYTPPAFMKPKGNEDAVYKYDRNKIEPMFGVTGPR